MGVPTPRPTGMIPAVVRLPPIVPDLPDLPLYSETQHSPVRLSNGEPSMMGNIQNLPYPTGDEQPAFTVNGNPQLIPQPPPMYNNIITTDINQYPQYPTTPAPSEPPTMGYREPRRINRSNHLGPSPVPDPPPPETPNALQQNQTNSDSLVTRANEIIAYFNTLNMFELTRQGFSDRVMDLFNEARSEMQDYPSRDHSNLRQVFRVLADHMMGNGLFSWAVYQSYRDVIG
jgi:hypothetical protein